ncbi:CFS_G0044750.mRNA.1.CDS.1 [Saccharomyces cerevisiae]|nr:CFS_G0044750.mRNA.1.CDS.1 [Saccharomyces cerevisiae]CAI7440193.1 CFS_G0044750.mRNA.1.CDS.1 [Saccharomyces cerevisiae]
MTAANKNIVFGFSRSISAILLICFFFEKVCGDMEHDMGMDDTSGYTRPEIVQAGSKSFHWLCTLGFLLLLPSVVTCLSFAGRIYSATLLQCTCWVKVCLAPVALFGFCREAHTGQCIAHGIMGSAFVLYGFIYVLVLVIPWIRSAQTSYSQDYVDSWVMCIWGVVNTFTEHRWGREGWSVHDYQHTFMGIIWWTGGILGIFLSRNGRRTFVPSLIIIFTGWAMSEHAQHLIISTKVHNMFGLVLMCGGALRIIEISFLLRDKRTLDKIHSFQYLAPFCLVCSGLLFMGANEEQLILVLRLGGDHSAYVLIIVSGAFLVYFWMIACLEFYLYLLEKGKQGFLPKSYELEEENNNVSFELDNISNEDVDEDTTPFNV